MKRLLTATAGLIASGLLVIGCSGVITWEWTASSAGGGSGGLVEEGGDGSTKSKLAEFYVDVDAGSDGSLDINTVATNQYWGDDLSDPNQIKTGNKEEVNYNQSLTLEPTKTEKNGSVYRIYYLATIQFGWNKFSTTARITRTATNAKGDTVTKEEEVNIEDTYLFGDFGGIIPLKVVLNWGNSQADLDLLVLEANQKAVYWGELGYNKKCCVSQGCVTDAQQCYQKDKGGDGYIVGEDRKTGVTYGSMDKDDRVNGGPEIYTLDPQEANINGAKVVAADYQDGDQFHVGVNYYKDFSKFAGGADVMVRPVVSIYINGSKTPRCFKTGDLVGQHEPADDPTKEMETVIKFGTFSFASSRQHSFSIGEGGTAGKDSQSSVGIEEFEPTGEICEFDRSGSAKAGAAEGGSGKPGKKGKNKGN